MKRRSIGPCSMILMVRFLALRPHEDWAKLAKYTSNSPFTNSL